MNLIDCNIDEFHDEGTVGRLEDREITSWLQGIFLFAFVWSVGASMDQEGRKHFDKLARELANGGMLEETRQKLALVEPVEPPLNPYDVPFPREGTVYDYRFVKEVSWLLSSFLYCNNLNAIIPKECTV